MTWADYVATAFLVWLVYIYTRAFIEFRIERRKNGNK